MNIDQIEFFVSVDENSGICVFGENGIVIFVHVTAKNSHDWTGPQQ